MLEVNVLCTVKFYVSASQEAGPTFALRHWKIIALETRRKCCLHCLSIILHIKMLQIVKYSTY